MKTLAPGRRRGSIRSEILSVIQKDVECAALELFESYSLSGSRAPTRLPSDGSDAVVAVIGFAAPQARGALVLGASVSSASRWLTAIAGSDVEASASDVLGEIANMLLGRLKSKLSDKGLLILMSTPTAAQGAAVEIAPNETSSWLAFSGDGWDLAVRVDAEFDEGFCWQETHSTPPAAPGDLMIF